MHTDTRKICKSVLIASFFALVTPAAGAGLVIGVAGAASAVGNAVDKTAFGERTETATPYTQAAQSAVMPEPIATHEPTPLSPLAVNYTVPSAQVAAVQTNAR